MAEFTMDLDVVFENKLRFNKHLGIITYARKKYWIDFGSMATSPEYSHLALFIN